MAAGSSAPELATAVIGVFIAEVSCRPKPVHKVCSTGSMSRV